MHKGWRNEEEHFHQHEHEHDPETIKLIFSIVKNMPKIEKIGDSKRVIAGVSENLGIDSVIEPFLPHSPFLAIVDVKNKSVVQVKIIKNELAGLRGGVGLGLAKWIIDNKADAVVAGRIGHHMKEAFDVKRIAVFYIDYPIPLKEAIEYLVNTSTL